MKQLIHYLAVIMKGVMAAVLAYIVLYALLFWAVDGQTAFSQVVPTRDATLSDSRQIPFVRDYTPYKQPERRQAPRIIYTQSPAVESTPEPLEEVSVDELQQMIGNYQDQILRMQDLIQMMQAELNRAIEVLNNHLADREQGADNE